MVSSTPRPYFIPQKDLVPIVQEAGWAQGRSGQVENLVPPGFDPRTVQPVVIRYSPRRCNFPFPASGKIYLYSILIFSTYLSLVHKKCQAVVLYRITNIDSLVPIRLMVLCAKILQQLCVILFAC